jgi:hypothetical protein
MSSALRASWMADESCKVRLKTACRTKFRERDGARQVRLQHKAVCCTRDVKLVLRVRRVTGHTCERGHP